MVARSNSEFTAIGSDEPILRSAFDTRRMVAATPERSGELGRGIGSRYLKQFENVVTDRLEPIRKTPWDQDSFVPADVGDQLIIGRIDPDAAAEDEEDLVPMGVGVKVVLPAAAHDLHRHFHEITPAQVGHCLGPPGVDLDVAIIEDDR
jgi:hypothetical protein